MTRGEEVFTILQSKARSTASRTGGQRPPRNTWFGTYSSPSWTASSAASTGMTSYSREESCLQCWGGVSLWISRRRLSAAPP